MMINIVGLQGFVFVFLIDNDLLFLLMYEDSTVRYPGMEDI